MAKTESQPRPTDGLRGGRRHADRARNWQVVRDGLAWHGGDAWRDRLGGPGSPDWLDLANDPRASLLKRQDVREVWRLQLDDAVFIVKVYKERGWLARVKEMVTGCTAQREYAITQQAAELGLTPSPVGYATASRTSSADRARHGRVSVLVLQDMGSPESLDRVWKRITSQPPSVRRGETDRLAKSLAAFVAGAHHLGFLHADCHPRNILVDGVKDGGKLHAEMSPAGMICIDLPGSRVRPSPTERQRIHNLASLAHWFLWHARRADRWRFLTHYVAEYCVKDGNPQSQSWMKNRRKELARKIIRACDQHARKWWKKRDRRILRGDGRYFATVELPDGWRGRVTVRLHHGTHFPAARRPECPPDEWKHRLASLLQCAPAERDYHELIIDRRPVFAVGRWLGWLGIRTPHQRAFVDAHRLRHRQIPCVCPMALLEHRPSGFLRNTALVYEDPALAEQDDAHAPPSATAPTCAPVDEWLSDRVDKEVSFDRERLVRERERLLADVARRGAVPVGMGSHAVWVSGGPDLRCFVHGPSLIAQERRRK